jgi:hypothetical protein
MVLASASRFAGSAALMTASIASSSSYMPVKGSCSFRLVMVAPRHRTSARRKKFATSSIDSASPCALPLSRI